jgi:formate/nitrite transporter FocA (FNT family)
VEIAQRAEDIGVKKGLDTLSMLRWLAGGSLHRTGGDVRHVVTSGSSGVVPYGVTPAVGIVFSLGLILVVVAGAECLQATTSSSVWASGKINLRALLLTGSCLYRQFRRFGWDAVLVYLTRQYTGGGAVGHSVNFANNKVNLDFAQAIALGVLCNALVCLAVWLTIGGRSTADKVLAILFPITAFVAAGFEHSIANMYFIPWVGLSTS